jgi:iron complex transport system ATP-binding protein
MTGEGTLLELNEATVVRQGRRILDALNLVLRSGEHTAIVGANGSGKSTLIKLFMSQIYPLARPGLPPPVLLFGRERWNVTELRSKMGIVTPDLQQSFVSGSSMGRVRGIDAVISGFFSSELLFFHHTVEPGMVRAAEEALAQVGAESLSRRKMNEMSTGEVRRVLIARALVHNPEVLLLDEPTAGLDIVARRDFMGRLSDLAAAGKTLVIVTHHVEEIIPAIRRVILLRDGKISADGAPDDVLTSSAVSKAFGAKVDVRRENGHYQMRLEE